MRCETTSPGVTECALCASSAHDVHHASVCVNVVIGVLVVLCELHVIVRVHVIPLCDAVFGLALSLIAHVVVVVFVEAILQNIFCIWRYTLYSLVLFGFGLVLVVWFCLFGFVCLVVCLVVCLLFVCCRLFGTRVIMCDVYDHKVQRCNNHKDKFTCGETPGSQTPSVPATSSPRPHTAKTVCHRGHPKMHFALFFAEFPLWTVTP